MVIKVNRKMQVSAIILHVNAHVVKSKCKILERVSSKIIN